MNELVTWVKAHGAALGTALGILGLVMFVGSLLLLPVLVARMPADYFVRTPPPRGSRSARTVILHLLRNTLGVVLVIGGIIMLVLPGQGLLTIAIGLLVLEFPGKRRLQAWILRRSVIRRGINWLRSRAHRPPLMFPGDPEPSSE
ncbi:MAG: PGPGW domain-containing protein [Phycisphaerales bacterium]|nr:PGPGW domain-containing protein [Phycisphaerales bacterium]